MADTPRKPRRWLQSAIAASARPQPALPFARSTRRRPAAVAQAPRPAAIAAR
jgi:hypothetical protein